MIKIIQVNGTDKQLYELVAPLVMDPKVIQYNQNYPFKTGEQFVWFIALSDDEIIGFIPLEQRNQQWVINNYYVNPNQESKGFKVLLKAISKFDRGKKRLTAIVQTNHKAYFSEQGFEITKEWKVYLKMEKKEKKQNENNTVRKKECL